MAPAEQRQLISYIAPAEQSMPRLRPEVGFTPRWHRAELGIDFGRRWHTDPGYRRETVVAMRELMRRRFPGTMRSWFCGII